MFGTLLTWLNDHTSDAFVVCTANDVSRLPPEFSRAERFDGVFFVDLPGRKQKDGIWVMYRELYGISEEEPQPNDEQWTGAEIRSCCRLAALLDVPLTQAAHNVVPVATTSAESVQRLREWASGRCLDAESGGVYSASSKKDSESPLFVRRKISRGNSRREAS
jgi:SpoVK/Ycf46/Vps4 family AAA+-type ATPase